MCGIVGIVRRRTTRETPSPQSLTEPVTEANDRLAGIVVAETGWPTDLVEQLGAVAELLRGVDRLLQGEAGLSALFGHAGLSTALEAAIAEAEVTTVSLESRIESDPPAAQLEKINAVVVELKDALWALHRDRLRAATEVRVLAGGTAPDPLALPWLFSIQQALSNIDRLEVRGRDSAGINVLVSGHGLDLDSDQVARLIADRGTNPGLPSASVRTPDGALSFVYKAAAEIGEMGDNTAEMRTAIANDTLLQMALSSPDAHATVLSHTRWASVGIISEPNAHPVNSEEQIDGALVSAGPYTVAVLNGDVDNFSDLIAQESLEIPAMITTDAKVIPLLVSRGLANGLALDEAVRAAVAQFEGSVAIGVNTVAAPRDLHLALRGSGQGVFVGLAEDAFVVASEPYGVVEDCSYYLRMDGEGSGADQGQIIRLSGDRAGEHAGATRYTYDGALLPVGADEWVTPSVTTRDIDRGDFPHYLLKEISEAPSSFMKTLRGRLITEDDGQLRVQLPPDTVPAEVIDRLQAVRRVWVIGQGTAAVAGEAVAAAISVATQGSGVPVTPITATQLSGFHLDNDMSDCLVVAISQSGTTTDTNRTVDLCRGRGATVLGIVNRRGSDLVDKADGILYTSDGRDVEMSVASTKAFYAQIAAGFLLADVLADMLPGVAVPMADRQAVLAGLKEIPDAMRATLDQRPQIAQAADRHALSRRYWALVGNGVNFVAARELRIKLSELCYKSIASDITEDKKHIDLSSEPLIFVCAAGLSGSNADDVAKEVAIFRAHKAAPIVVATQGENRFSSALEVIWVPPVHPRLAFILSAMAGHLFGYEAALAIDASAKPLREARSTIERYVDPPDQQWFEQFTGELAPLAAAFFSELRSGRYNGQLEASTAVQLASLLRFATAVVPLEAYQIEMGKVATPGVIVEDLARVLTDAIEELTRPVDAIKHQAKTVTVGISRADESLLQDELIKLVLAAGPSRDHLSYSTLRTLLAVSPAVTDVIGSTRYRVDGNPREGATLHVLDKSGLAVGLRSRTEDDPTLRGTKRRVAVEREPIVTVGTDGRVVLIVPEVKDSQTVGLTLCHLALNDHLDAGDARTLLTGYRNRYRQLVDYVTEREPTFRDDLLASVPVIELLSAGITRLAQYWVE